MGQKSRVCSERESLREKLIDILKVNTTFSVAVSRVLFTRVHFKIALVTMIKATFNVKQSTKALGFVYDFVLCACGCAFCVLLAFNTNNNNRIPESSARENINLVEMSHKMSQ